VYCLFSLSAFFRADIKYSKIGTKNNNHNNKTKQIEDRSKLSECHAADSVQAYLSKFVDWLGIRHWMLIIFLEIEPKLSILKILLKFENF